MRNVARAGGAAGIHLDPEPVMAVLWPL